jgi:hypothetical protein
MTISPLVGPKRRGAESQPLEIPSGTYRFVAPRGGRMVVVAVLLAALLVAAWAGYRGASTKENTWYFVAAGALVVVVAMWAYLQARVPQTVTLTNSVIEIRNNGHVERFDLADPSVEVLARDGEMALRCYDGRFALVRARDVNWKLFTHVVMHYQNHADRKAEERQARFSR